MTDMKNGCIVLLVLFVLCLLCGCRGVRYVPVETVRVDSTVIRDTMIDVRLVPYRDSVATSDTASYLSNPYAWSWAVWSGGVLHHSLIVWPNGSMQVKVPYFIDRIIRIREPQVVEVEKEFTRWEKIRIEVGGYAIVIATIAILIVVGRFIHKLRKGG